jgi:hypothetical protein
MLEWGATRLYAAHTEYFKLQFSPPTLVPSPRPASGENDRHRKEPLVNRMPETWPTRTNKTTSRSGKLRLSRLFQRDGDNAVHVRSRLGSLV